MKRTVLVALFFLCLIGLAVTCFAGTSNVTFTWTPTVSTGATGYRLYQSHTSGSYTYGAGAADLAATIPGTTTSTYTLTGLVDGTYFWVMTAYNANGESGPSGQVTATLNSTYPSQAPAGFQGVVVTVTVTPSSP
jgi:hypothetical protein